MPWCGNCNDWSHHPQIAKAKFGWLGMYCHVGSLGCICVAYLRFRPVVDLRCAKSHRRANSTLFLMLIHANELLGKIQKRLYLSKLKRSKNVEIYSGYLLQNAAARARWTSRRSISARPSAEDPTIVSGCLPPPGLSTPNRRSTKPLNPMYAKSQEGHGLVPWVLWNGVRLSCANV
jgi:hypothetical protein